MILSGWTQSSKKIRWNGVARCLSTGKAMKKKRWWNVISTWRLCAAWVHNVAPTMQFCLDSLGNKRARALGVAPWNFHRRHPCLAMLTARNQGGVIAIKIAHVSSFSSCFVYFDHRERRLPSRKILSGMTRFQAVTRWRKTGIERIVQRFFIWKRIRLHDEWFELLSFFQVFRVLIKRSLDWKQ